MSATLDAIPSMIDRIRHDLVGLKMPRALEALDHVVRRLEHGELSALEAIDILLSEELTLREYSRIKTALRMGSLRRSRRSPALTSPFSHLSTGIASSPWRSSASSIVTRPSISSAHRERTKVISPRPSASKP